MVLNINMTQVAVLCFLEYVTLDVSHREWENIAVSDAC